MDDEQRHVERAPPGAARSWGSPRGASARLRRSRRLADDGLVGRSKVRTRGSSTRRGRLLADAVVRDLVWPGPALAGLPGGGSAFEAAQRPGISRDIGRFGAGRPPVPGGALSAHLVPDFCISSSRDAPRDIAAFSAPSVQHRCKPSFLQTRTAGTVETRPLLGPHNRRRGIPRRPAGHPPLSVAVVLAAVRREAYLEDQRDDPAHDTMPGMTRKNRVPASRSRGSCRRTARRGRSAGS